MKVPLLLVTLLACAFPGRAPAQQPAVPPLPAAPPAGSVSLWNGRDLSGWVVFLKNDAPPPPGFFKAGDDGVLRFAAKSTGYVRTRQSFTNYRLHVEYRWPDKIANSGIFVHVRAPDVLWPYSVQSNLKLDMTGDLIPQGGFAFNGSTETVKKSGAFNEKPAGEWNGCDIFCREDSIEVFVNGERKNFVEKISANSGGIALQLEGAPIEFRNLWLQELAPPKTK